MKIKGAAIALLMCLGCMTGCSKAIEKEYTMEIQSLCQTDDSERYLAHCKRGFSLFNYYIEVPELPEVEPTKLKAKETNEKSTFIVNEKKVTDHGYKFISWGE